MTERHVRLDVEALETFCREIFVLEGLSYEDAQAAATVLVAADVRGIASHGVGRLSRYVKGLQAGLMLPNAPIEVVSDTPTALVLDAHGAMGAPVSVRAMKAVIDKAHAAGAAFGCVRDSNHFGIAGYYALLAVDHGMLGIAMTNTAALAVPTFGRQVMFGTNPLAFAAPAHEERAFLLDMSTTVVTRGKLELYDRMDKELPPGWAVDRHGRTARQTGSLLEDMFYRVGGGILPLGGEGEEMSGHKGYGLAVMVDILCGVLAGAGFGPQLADLADSSTRVGHFFGALRIDAFRDLDTFRRDMDRMLQDLRNTPTTEGQERVYYAGLKEFEHEEKCRRQGVPVLAKSYEVLCQIGQDHGVAAPPALSEEDL